MKVSDTEPSPLAPSLKPEPKRRINYEGLLAYTDRNHKRESKPSYKEESGKKLPLTSRDTVKSTSDFAKNKPPEYIPKGSAKGSSNVNSKKKLSLGSTESMNFKWKKFSLQTTGPVGSEEKFGMDQRPLTGSTLAAIAYGTSSGVFLKRSVLSTGTQEDQPNSNVKDQPPLKKASNGSLSSRIYKGGYDNGSLFMNAQSEYQRNTLQVPSSKYRDTHYPSSSISNPLLGKARLSKPELKDNSAKINRLSLKAENDCVSKVIHASGVLTDRVLTRESKTSISGPKSNVLVRVTTANLVQASKFNKHISQANGSKTDDYDCSGGEKKFSHKLIVITDDKTKMSAPNTPTDYLLGRSRKSAVTLTGVKTTARPSVKAQQADKLVVQRNEVKSILSEINLIKCKLDKSAERPLSSNKPRNSALNRKPLY